MELKENKFDKVYYLDTNIILDDATNIYELSQDGKNLILINDVVLDELDGKKTGFDLVAFQAREFNRFCEKAELIKVGVINDTAKRNIIRKDNLEIHFVALNEYYFTIENTDVKILNDRRIIECAQKIKDEYPNLVVLSNDIAFRSRANLEGVVTESFRTKNKKISELEFFKTYEVTEDLKFPISVDEFKNIVGEVPKSCSGFEIINTITGKPVYCYKSGSLMIEVDDKLLSKQDATPINMRQKILSHICLDGSNDIIVVEGAAGCGKNIVTMSAACSLMNAKESKFDKIVYIRKTVTSVDNKQEELGFLPGTFEEKMGPYLAPLYNTVEKLVKIKYKANRNLRNPEALKEKVDEFFKDHNIQIAYEGFLRGSTIENAIVILDEFQNDSQGSAKLIFTRMGENTKVFVLGCVDQIDNAYVNKQNNAITFLLNESTKTNAYDVNIMGIDLTESVRSKIAKYADSW